MSNLPPLESPVPIGNVTARCLLEARKHVRRIGRAAALDALRGALDSSRTTLAVTLWWGGQRSTFGGRPDRPGAGGLIEKPLAFHAEHLAVLAQGVHAKGEGPCRTLGRSRHGGSSDVEFLARTGLFLDADDCGAPDRLTEALHDVGLGYLHQKRSAKLRWHTEIPFALPLLPPESATSRESLASWKNDFYRPATGWLLGFFSELGELDCRFELHAGAVSVSKLGVDAVPGDRLLALGNPYTRREEGEAAPATTHSDGAFLDVARLLAGTGFTPPPPQKRRNGKAPGPEASHSGKVPSAAPECSDNELFEPAEPEDATAFGNAATTAFTAAGLTLNAVKGLAIIRCPFAEKHSTGTDGDTSTAILPNGYIKCFHGSCAARSQWDFLNALPTAAQLAFMEELPAIGAESECALFAPAVIKLFAQLSSSDPLVYARIRQATIVNPNTMRRWVASVRKERRS